MENTEQHHHVSSIGSGIMGSSDPKKSPVVKLVMGILIIIVVIIAIVSIKYLSKNSGINGLMGGENASLVREAQKTPNEDEYKDWITYMNSKNNISIKMPNNWLIDEGRNEKNEPTGEVTFNPTDTENSQATKIWLGIGTSKAGMNTPDEFNKAKELKNGGKLDAAGVEKLGTASTKAGDAVLFVSKQDGSEDQSLLSWINIDGTNVYVQTFKKGEINEQDVMFHKYLVSSIQSTK